MKYCTKCKQVIENDSCEYCSRCGTKLETLQKKERRIVKNNYNIFNFNGELTRFAFCAMSILNVIIFIIGLYLIATINFDTDSNLPFTILCITIILCIYINVNTSIKRLRNMELSPNYAWLIINPYYWFIIFFYLLLMKDKNENIFDIKGKINRIQFFKYVIWCEISIIVMLSFFGLLTQTDITQAQTINSIGIALLIPILFCAKLCAGIKRIRDIGWHPANVIILFIPAIKYLGYLGLLLQPSNKYTTEDNPILDNIYDIEAKNDGENNDNT